MGNRIGRLELETERKIKCKAQREGRGDDCLVKVNDIKRHEVLSGGDNVQKKKLIAGKYNQKKIRSLEEMSYLKAKITLVKMNPKSKVQGRGAEKATNLQFA